MKNTSEQELVKRVGNTIRGYRLSNNISQETLAERSNLTSTYIGQLERGNMNPTVSTLQRITTALNISLLELFEESENSKSTADSPELFRFVQYLKNLPPEQITSIHQFLQDITK